MSAKKKAGKVAKRAKAAKAPAKRAKPSAAKKPVAKKAAAKGKALSKKAAKAKPVVKTKSVAKAKPVAKTKAPTKAKPVAKTKPAVKAKPNGAAIQRRDGAGHLNPKYAADLRARSKNKQRDDDRAFGGDALSQELGEEFVETITSGEDEGNEVRDQRVTEELGGPFTVTSAGTEFAGDVDASNPKGASREPFPRT